MDTAEQILGTKPKNKQNKLSTPTKQLIKERKIQLRKNVDAKILNEMSKKIKREIRKDIRTYNTNCINDTIERNKGPKVFQKQISWRKEEIHKLKNPNGKILTNKDDIINAIKDFYQELYNSQVREIELIDDKRAKLSRHITEDLPEITVLEIQNAIKTMKNNKATGPDDLSIELLKYSNNVTLEFLKNLFNTCLDGRASNAPKVETPTFEQLFLYRIVRKPAFVDLKVTV